MQCNKRRQWTALQTSEPWCIVSDFIAAAFLCCKTSQVCTCSAAHNTHCSTSMQAVNPNGLQIGWDRLGSGWNWGDKPGLGLLPTFTISVFERFLVGNLNLLRVFKKGVVFQSLIVNCWKLMDKSGDAEIWHPRHNSNPVGGPKGVEGVSHLDARRNRGQRLTIVCKSNSQAQNGFANICKLILSNFMLRPFVLASSISLSCLFLRINGKPSHAVITTTALWVGGMWFLKSPRTVCIDYSKGCCCGNIHIKRALHGAFKSQVGSAAIAFAHIRTHACTRIYVWASNAYKSASV